jgi:glycosyltransferase involved in cell wall biosynthesis
VDEVVVCDDGSGDLTGEVAEATCLYNQWRNTVLATLGGGVT